MYLVVQYFGGRGPRVEEHKHPFKKHFIDNCKFFVFIGCLCSSALDPRPPSRRPSVPNILQGQIHEKSIYITYSRLYLFRIKTLTYSRYSKNYLERSSYGVQNKWKVVFFINNKRNGKNFMMKYIQ